MCTGNVPYIDTTGESNLSSIVNHFKNQGGLVFISEIQNQPRQMLLKTRLDEIIGQGHIFDKTGEAVSFALTKLNFSQCLGCKHFAFRECQQLSNPSG
ncbi:MULTISPECIES: sodium-independent anion transporter [unclassified Paenibacillus]|uniref:sodium-independent anion transporter n=1 Tax=unclassified Paenibacillus TaxID=185978 RepID=UPI0009E79399